MRQKLKTMVTDPARVRRTDPGNPDVCPVGDLHKIFSDRQTMAKVNEGCRSAGIGCIECKGWAADALVSILNPMQERRKKYEDNPRLAWDILEAGSARRQQGCRRHHGRGPRRHGHVARLRRTRAWLDNAAKSDARANAPAIDAGSIGWRQLVQMPAALKPKPRKATSPLPSPWAMSTKGRSTCCST